MESRTHAEARGAHIYAVVDKIEGDRGSRDDRGLEKRLGRLSGLANDATPAISSSSPARAASSISQPANGRRSKRNFRVLPSAVTAA